ncbi:MAG: hypothetical protein ACRDO8_05930, partial [Nocardioidaceae bacterium]
LFDRPPRDWSDAELRHGLAELGKAIQWHRDQHQDADADALYWVSVALAEERDARRRLARDVNEAMDLGGPARWLANPSERRTRRRHHRGLHWTLSVEVDCVDAP